MGIDDPRNGGQSPLEFLCDRQIVGSIADGPNVDLRRQSEVQDLRDDVGGLEVERVFGKSRRQDLTQLPDVVRSRLMAPPQRDQNDTVVDADGRAIREGQVVRPCGQSNVVDNERAILLGNDFADLVLNLLEYGFGTLNPRSRRRADMELDLASVDQRKEVPAHQAQHHRS